MFLLNSLENRLGTLNAGDYLIRDKTTGFIKCIRGYTRVFFVHTMEDIMGDVDTVHALAGAAGLIAYPVKKPVGSNPKVFEYWKLRNR